ncbi:thermonuclease family protein [Sporolactobacillus sp. CPB3-1]|uniref:Thermonuclease family protein n=1 Tax=Sporolactobacillus mangiferae TaxID=2940498 RepID=A0ABT0M7C3_9BACL|nr:thermonuclease family protein [Sporolactobacillus mangiferae]MCL1630751.1 thermonuclease family protein [Sporolactobacillus mangiferae]
MNRKSFSTENHAARLAILKNGCLRAFLSLLVCALLFGCSEEVGTGATGSSTAPGTHASAVNETAGSYTKTIRIPDNGVTAKVVKVIDGDTFEVLYKGKVTTVRVLLIDTPETHHPKLGVQPYGPEASAHAHQLLDGKRVTLELAKDGARDKYGRLLAYVFVGGQSFEALQLSAGLARVAYVYPPNTKYLNQFQAIEQQSRAKKLKIWAVSGYAASDGFHSDVMKGTKAYNEIHKDSSHSAVSTESNISGSGQSAPNAQGNCSGLIKGNVSSRGKIYHMPSDPYYKVTKAEVCFKNRSDAQQAGFRAAR